MEEIPDFMKGRGSKLRGLSDVDTGKVKSYQVEREILSVHSLIKVERPPLVRPAGVRDPDWLLRGEPREVQLEALRRSYLGYALRDSAEDVERFQHLRDGPARGWGHFMEMRLGKTPTALNEFALLRRDYDFRNMIVLSPNAFKRTWAKEADSFNLDVPSFVFDSGSLKALQRFVRSAKGQYLLSINYEALRSDKVLAFLEEECGDKTAIYADESITIKGFGSQISSNSLQLAKSCKVRRPMTGKPITQGPHDAYAQLRFARQLEGTMYTNFKARYCKMGGFQGKTIVGIRNEEELSDTIHSSSFVARKTQWLKTPGRDYGERFLELSEEQKTLYAAMEQEFMVELANGVTITADQIVTKLIKMQQITSGFIYDEARGVHWVVPTAKNPLVAAVKRFMEEELEGKLILVCHYQPTMDLFIKALEEYNPAVIRGQDWHRKNERPIDDEKARFNDDPQCRVMIGQEISLRYGHTLMGNQSDPCYTTIFVENNYSLNDRSQCEERNQGSGQQYPIAILDFFASDRAYRIVKAIQAKEDVSAVIMRYAREEGVLPGRGPVEDDRV